MDASRSSRREAMLGPLSPVLKSNEILQSPKGALSVQTYYFDIRNGVPARDVRGLELASRLLCLIAGMIAREDVIRALEFCAQSEVGA